MPKLVSYRTARSRSIGKMWNYFFSSNGLAKRVIIPSLVIAIVMPFLLSTKLHDSRQRATGPTPTASFIQTVSDVAISSLQNGQEVTINAQIRLSALVNPNLAIKSISFFVNNRSVCTYINANSSCYWVVPTQEGDYMVTAQVTTMQDQVITSPEVHLRAVKR